MVNITTQRNRDFLKECKKRAAVLKMEGQNATIDDIVDFVLLNPAPRYYADQSRIYPKVIKALAGMELDFSNDQAREGFDDLIRDLKAACAAYPCDSVRLNLMRLTAGMFGSPRFYIGRQRAMKLARLIFDNYVA